MRQAQRAGAKVAVLDPRPVSLPFEYAHWPLTPDDLNSALQELMRPVLSGSAAESQGKNALAGLDAISPHASEIHQTTPRFQALEAMLQNSQRPVIVCGTDIVGLSVITAAADLALQLQAGDKHAGLFYVLPGANAYGAAIASKGCEPFSEILGAIETGEVRALLLVETDPLYYFPDLERVKTALLKLELLVVLDYLPNRTLAFAGQAPATIRSSVPVSTPTHISIPTLTHFETRASFINQEGRLQQADSVHCGGMPLSQLTGGNHPPRKYRKDIPGACAKAAWQVLSELEATLSPAHPAIPSFRDLWSRIERQLDIAVHIESNRLICNDSRLFLQGSRLSPFTLIPAMSGTTSITDNSIELFFVEGIFGSEELSGYSNVFDRVDSAPQLRMHPADAAKRGLSDGDLVTVRLPFGTLRTPLKIFTNMAQGVAILPRNRHLTWQQDGEGSLFVDVFQKNYEI